MKKIFLIILSALFITGCTTFAVTKTQKKSEIKKSIEVPQASNSNFDIVTLFSSPCKNPDRLWVGTFQLVFNDMKNNILKQNVKFAGEEPTEDLIGLNSEEFTKDMLNESSYYTSYGKTALSEKIKIEKDLKAKFNTSSDIIGNLDWSEAPGRYYAYAMIKKDFEFFKEFDKLGNFSFNNSDKKYEFFGIDKNSDEMLYDNLNILFYNNENDYAIQLLTKSHDIIYLYRTESKDSFKKIYAKMLKERDKYLGERSFQGIDTLKIPNLKFNSIRSYDELCNKSIEGTDLIFSSALETIEMELNNKGGKIKSEALLMTENAVMIPVASTPRHFNFDKTFVTFLIDSDKKDPYLAFQINNLDKFIK